MTVQVIVNPTHYQGLSGDTKPASPPAGSTYHAVDTGEEWVYLDGMWERDLRLAKALEIVLI